MPGEAGQVAGQVGGEPAPQVAGVGVEQHGGGVVVAVRAHRLAEPGIVFDVPGRAGDVAAVRAAAGVSVAAGAARQHGLAAHPPGVDRAEGRGGEGGEHARVRGDRLGDAFAAGQAGADELPGVALVDLASRPGRRSHGGCRTRRAALRRVRRRCRRRGRVRRWPGRWRRCGRGAGWGAAAGAGELAFPGAEVGPGDGRVVGGRPRSRARDGFGTQGGCRGSISRHSHHLPGSW